MTSILIVSWVTQETLRRDLLNLSGGQCSLKLPERDVYFKNDTLNIFYLVLFIKNDLWAANNFVSPKGVFKVCLFVCLFVWLFGDFCPTREFFIHLETSPLPVKVFRFWPLLSTHVIKQWGFFTMPLLLWHGPTIYCGHLRGLVTLTPVAGRLGVKLSLPF